MGDHGEITEMILDNRKIKEADLTWTVGCNKYLHDSAVIQPPELLTPDYKPITKKAKSKDVNFLIWSLQLRCCNL